MSDKTKYIELIIIFTVVCILFVGVYLAGKDSAMEKWCEDKGGVFVELTCIDKSAVIVLDKE